MKYISEYYFTDFKEKVKFNYLRLLTICTIGFFIILTIFTGMGEGENHSKYESLKGGFENLTFQSAFLKLAISFIIVALIIIYLYYRNKNRRLIVGLTFTDQEVITETRNIFTSEIKKTTIAFSELCVNSERISDGITPPMYDCYLFMEKSNKIGYLLKNHFMWEKEKIEKIEYILDKKHLIKNNGTEHYCS